MYCQNCGKEITQDSTFCMYCGYKLNTENIEIIPNPAINDISSLNAAQDTNTNKKLLLCIGILILTVLLMLITPSTSSIIGTWKSNSELAELKFTSSGYLTNNSGLSAKYKIIDDILYIEEDDGLQVDTFNFNIKGNTLTLTPLSMGGLGDTEYFQRTRIKISIIDIFILVIGLSFSICIFISPKYIIKNKVLS